MGAVFEIWTWGSCRHSTPVIVHPRFLDLRDITGFRGEHEVDLGFARIRYVNGDSRRNLHRSVEFVEVREPVVVYVDLAESCSYSREHAYLVDNSGARELEVRERTLEAEEGRWVVTYVEEYVELNNMHVALVRREVYRRPNYPKLQVELAVANGMLVVKGDTYPIKDILRELGLHWRPGDKAWVGDASTLGAVVGRLRGLGVPVKEPSPQP